MKTIENLMEAYSSYLALPMVLVTSASEEIYKTNYKQLYMELDTITGANFAEISKKIEHPIIVSAMETVEDEECFYILTPTFTFQMKQLMFISGPFKLGNQATRNVKFLTEEQLDTTLQRMRTFFNIVENRLSMLASHTVPDEIIQAIRLVINENDMAEIDNVDFNQIFLEFLKNPTIDFLGIASKQDDIFVVEQIKGGSMEELIHEKFYIGEGLLGNAVILGDDFNWNKKSEIQRAEFFNKFGFFPNHLFGSVLMDVNDVDSVLFGGNFTNKAISERLISFIKCTVQFLKQKETMNMNLQEAQYWQSNFMGWLDLMDVAMHTKDKTYICYKILDFCQIVNKGLFTCFTMHNSKVISRGEFNEEIYTLHQKVNLQQLVNMKTKFWRDEECIHLFSQDFGLLTVQCNNKINYKQLSYILMTIEKVLERKELSTRTLDSISTSTIFDVLNSGLKDLDPIKYEKSIIISKVFNHFMDIGTIQKQHDQLFQNISKVMMYSMDFLAQQIDQTEEWDYLKAAKSILDGEHNIENRQEIDILAYLYALVILEDTSSSYLNVSEKIKEDCKLFIDDTQSPLLTSSMNTEAFADSKQDFKGIIDSLTITAREKQILYLLLEGLNNNEVAHYLKISTHTVKNHVTNIYKKLNVSDRMQAIAKIYRIKYEDS